MQYFVFCGALFAWGCGGDSEAEDPPTDDPQAPQQEPTDTATDAPPTTNTTPSTDTDTTPITEPCEADLSPLADAAATWGESLEAYAADCCDSATACAANPDCAAYHQCVYACLLYPDVGQQQACFSACQGYYPAFNDDGDYQQFSGCLL